MKDVKFLKGNSLDIMRNMEPDSINLIVTSPPYYGMRIYGKPGFGNEESPEKYVSNALEFTYEMHRILRKDGTLYLNLGDKYHNDNGQHRRVKSAKKFGRKSDVHFLMMENRKIVTDGKWLQKKQQLFLPHRIAIGMQDEQSWIFRNDNVWLKNAQPNYAQDRRMPSKEFIFHSCKSNKPFFDKSFSKDWDVMKFSVEGHGRHSATFPPSLIKNLILSSSRSNDIVYDPFGGSGTTAAVAIILGRRAVISELETSYCDIIEKNIELAIKISKTSMGLDKKIFEYASMSE